MFAWLKTWLAAWAERSLNREIERLRAENVSLKAEALEATGEQQIQLTPEEQQQLNALGKEIDPEVLQRIDLLSDAEEWIG